jgi:predicted RNase H-like HicB family nuclease
MTSVSPQAEDVDNVRRPKTKRHTGSSQGGPMRYRIAVHQSDEGYSVSVPGLPGCWSQGATDAEAVENIEDATREYLAVVEEQLRGEEIRMRSSRRFPPTSLRASSRRVRS